LQEINREENEYRKTIGKSKDSIDEKKAQNFIRGIEEGKRELFIGYFYYQRKEAIEFIFRSKLAILNEEENKIVGWKKNKITMKSFLGYSIKKESDFILSWIDKIFSDLDSMKLFVITILGDSITDYYIVNEEKLK